MYCPFPNSYMRKVKFFQRACTRVCTDIHNYVSNRVKIFPTGRILLHRKDGWKCLLLTAAWRLQQITTQWVPKLLRLHQDWDVQPNVLLCKRFCQFPDKGCTSLPILQFFVHCSKTIFTALRLDNIRLRSEETMSNIPSNLKNSTLLRVFLCQC